MPSTEQIRSTISSTQKTAKITGAMELVAASKLGKTRQRMAMSKPYAKKMLEVIGHIANSSSEYKHAFLQQRSQVRRVGMIIVSTDRGLCGGLNLNLFKVLLKQIQEFEQKGVEVDLCLIGSKALGFFKRYGGNVVAHKEHLGDQPRATDVIGVVQTMLDAYHKETIDQLYLASNEFVTTMSQKPTVLQLLPLQPTELEHSAEHWDYIYEPSAKEVMDVLLDRYIESEVYQAVIENIACEQAARMVAMKSATDNAKDIIDDLRLAYNKARQAAITQELAEIVSGADAV